MISLSGDRDLGLRVGYEASALMRVVPFEEYALGFTNWDVWPILHGSECIGALYWHEPNCEMHLAVLQKWRKRWITRDFLKAIFKFPRIVTRVPEGHEYMIATLQKAGFKMQPDGTLLREAHGY